MTYYSDNKAFLSFYINPGHLMFSYYSGSNVLLIDKVPINANVSGGKPATKEQIHKLISIIFMSDETEVNGAL